MSDPSSQLADTEITESIRARFAQDLPTYLESWPNALAALSFCQRRLPLSDDEIDALTSAFNARDCEDAAPENADFIRETLNALRNRLDTAVAAFPDGAFVRLGSRSPKDSWEGMRNGFRCRDGARALDLLLDSTERIWDDLSVARRAGHRSSLYARAWRDLPAWAEFRCMVQNSKLIGASQYDYHDLHPEIGMNSAAIASTLEEFVTQRVIPALHLDAVVVDIAFIHGDLGRPILVEINPFSHMTDPCLFRDCNPMTSGKLPLFDFRFHGDGRDHGIKPRPSREELNILAASMLSDS